MRIQAFVFSFHESCGLRRKKFISTSSLSRRNVDTALHPLRDVAVTTREHQANKYLQYAQRKSEHLFFLLPSVWVIQSREPATLLPVMLTTRKRYAATKWLGADVAVTTREDDAYQGLQHAQCEAKHLVSPFDLREMVHLSRKGYEVARRQHENTKQSNTCNRYNAKPGICFLLLF